MTNMDVFKSIKMLANSSADDARVEFSIMSDESTRSSGSRKELGTYFLQDGRPQSMLHDMYEITSPTEEEYLKA